MIFYSPELDEIIYSAGICYGSEGYVTWRVEHSLDPGLIGTPIPEFDTLLIHDWIFVGYL